MNLPRELVENMNIWQTKKIIDFAKVVAGGTPSTEIQEYWNGDIGWITPADLSGYKFRYISKGERNITELGLNKSSACLLPKNTVLLSSRAPIGYVAIAENELATNQGFKNLICDETQVDYRFIYYWLSLNTEVLKSFASGATFPEISASKVKKIKAIIPALSTQKHIADILSTYDDLIENNNLRIALLEKAAQELYKEWFVRFRFPGHETAKFENGFPTSWKIKKVKDVVKRFPFGKLYKESDVSSEGEVIVIDQSKEAYIGFHNELPSHIASVDSPIIIFGDHSCKFQLMITPFSLSENVVPFTAIEDINTAYLYYLVKDLIETTEYKRHWTELMSKKVIVADSDIQKEFCKHIKNNLILIESLKTQNRNLAKQRDLLLPRLMSGKLEV